MVVKYFFISLSIRAMPSRTYFLNNGLLILQKLLRLSQYPSNQVLTPLEINLLSNLYIKASFKNGYNSGYCNDIR